MGTPEDAVIHMVNDHELAEMLRISVATARRWRLLKQGPRYIKVGFLCRYRIDDITAWLAARPTGGAHLPPGSTETAGRVSARTTPTVRRTPKEVTNA